MSCFGYISKRKDSRSAPTSAAARSAAVSNSSTGQSDGSSAGGLMNQSTGTTSSPRSIPDLYEERAHKLRVFDIGELRSATNDFNRKLKIGEGGFGSVYKGLFSPLDGKGGERVPVAIKMLNTNGLQVIYRDFKSSNVLLDENFKPKLSDFGLAREGPKEGRSHVTTAVVGTYGYAAPEYVETGHLTVKSDIWGFGVFLFEILTGRRSLERKRPPSEQKLLEWVRQFPINSWKFSIIMDPGLRNDYSLDAAREIANLANSCLVKNPKDRPTMSEIIECLKRAMQMDIKKEPAANINVGKTTPAHKNSQR